MASNNASNKLRLGFLGWFSPGGARVGASLVMTGGSWGGGMVGVGGRPDVVCGILFLGVFMPDGSIG